MSDSETPIVRDGTPADLAQIVPLFLHSLDTSLPGTTFSDLPAYAPRTVAASLRARLFPPRTLRLYVLARPSSGEVVAYANVKRTPTAEEQAAETAKYGPHPRAAGDPPELDMFFVKAGMGGRGYGGLLLEAIKRDWAGRGGLQLYVFKRNARARGFYEKFGFRTEAEWDLEMREPMVLAERICLMSWQPSP